MQPKRVPILLLLAGIVVLTTTLLAASPNQPARAQCGSQASSCKNCHEVQGQDPVNADGTGWHQSHAFGDFCYICHAGNNQATEKEAAHTGMEAPLADIKASCQQCHPNDLEARAQVYATTLGVEIDSSSAPEATPEENVASPTSETNTSVPFVTELDVNDPNLVDYVQRYNEVVLGIRPFNLGNTILWIILGLLVVGGGGFVATRELGILFRSYKKVEGEYPIDIVDMLPVLATLKPQARESLKDILENPDQATKLAAWLNEITTERTSKEER